MSAIRRTESSAPTYEKLLFVYDKIIQYKTGVNDSFSVDPEYSTEFIAFLHEISFLMPLHYGLYDRIIHAGYFLSATLEHLKKNKDCSPLSAFLTQVSIMYKKNPVPQENDVLVSRLGIMALLVQEHDTRHQHELLSVLSLEQRETHFPVELESYQAEIVKIFQCNFGERPDLAESGFNFLICSHLVIFYFFWAKINGLRIREFVAESELWQLELVLHEWILEMCGLSEECVDQTLLSNLKDLERSLTHANKTAGWYTKKTVVCMQRILEQLEKKANETGETPENVYECYLHYKYNKRVQLTDRENGTIVKLDEFLCNCMFDIQKLTSPGPYKIELPAGSDKFLKPPFNIFQAMQSFNAFEFVLSLPVFCNGSSTWKQSLSNNALKYTGICQYVSAGQRGMPGFFSIENMQDEILKGKLSEVTSQMITNSAQFVERTFQYHAIEESRLKDLTPLFSIASEWTRKDYKRSEDLLLKLQDVERYYECFSMQKGVGLNESREMREMIRPILRDYVQLIQTAVTDEKDTEQKIKTLERAVSKLKSGEGTADLRATVIQLERENGNLKQEIQDMLKKLSKSSDVSDSRMKNMQAGDSTIEQLSAENLRLEKQLFDCRTESNVQIRKNTKLEEVLMAKNAEIATLEGEVSKHKSSMTSNDGTQAEIEALKNKLEICKQENSTHESNFKKLQGERTAKNAQCKQVLETLAREIKQTTGSQATKVGEMETSVVNAIELLQTMTTDFERIESKLASNSQEHQVEIEEFKNRLAQKDADVNHAQQELTTAKKELEDAKGEILEFKGKCTELQSNLTEKNAQCKQLLENIAREAKQKTDNQKTKVGEMETSVDDAIELLQTMTTDFKAIELKLASNSQQHQVEIEEFKNRLAQNEADANHAQEELTTAKQKLEDAKGEILELQNKCTELQSNLTEKNAQCKQLLENIAREAKQKTDNQKTKVGEMETSVDDAIELLQTMTTDFKAIELKLASNSQQHQVEIGEFKNRLAQNEADLNQAQEELTTAKNELAQHKADAQARMEQKDARIIEIQNSLTLCSTTLEDVEKDLAKKVKDFQNVLDILGNERPDTNYFDIESINYEIDGLETEQKQKIEEIMRKHNDAFNRVQSKIKEMEDVVSTLESDIVTSTRKFETFEQLTAANQQLTFDNASKISNIADLTSQLAEKDAELTRLQQQVTDKDAEMKRLVKEVCGEHQQTNKRQQEKFNRAVTITKQKISEFEDASSQNKTLKEELERTLNQQEHSIKVLEAENEELERVLKSQEHAIQTIKTLERLRSNSVINEDTFDQYQRFVKEIHSLQEIINQKMTAESIVREQIKSQTKEIEQQANEIKTLKREVSQILDRLGGALEAHVLLDEESDKMEEAKFNVQMMVDLMTNYYKQEREKNKNLEEQFNNIVTKLQQQDDAKSELQTQNEGLNSKLTESENAQRELQVENDTLKTKLKDCEKATADLRTQHERLNSKLTESENAQRELQVENETLKTQLKDCEKATADLRTQHERLNSKLTESENAQRELQVENETLKTQLKDCEKATADLRTQHERLNSKLTESENAQRELQVENETLKTQLKDCEEATADLRTQHEGLNSKLTESENAQRELQVENETLKTQLADLQTQHEELRMKLVNCERAKMDLETEMESLRMQLKECEKGHDELFKESERAQKGLQDEKEALETRVNNCVAEREKCLEEQRKLQADVQELQNTKAKLQKELEDCRGEQNKLQPMIDALKRQKAEVEQDAETQAKSHKAVIQEHEKEIEKLSRLLEASEENYEAEVSEHTNTKNFAAQIQNLHGDDEIQEQVDQFTRAIEDLRRRNQTHFESVFDIVNALITLSERDLSVLRNSSVADVCMMLIECLKKSNQRGEHTSTINLLDLVRATDGDSGGPDGDGAGPGGDGAGPDAANGRPYPPSAAGGRPVPPPAPPQGTRYRTRVGRDTNKQDYRNPYRANP
jgi:chromosome segregation ATPase